MPPRPKKCTAKCRNRLLYSVNPLSYSAALPGALVPAKFELVRGEIKLTILLLPIYHTMECSFFGPEASLLCNVIPVFVYCRRRRSQQSGPTEKDDFCVYVYINYDYSFVPPSSSTSSEKPRREVFRLVLLCFAKVLGT